ncbi:MAG: hypothetical protein JKY65_16820 [Planctomycetes bacterium]|nr:hypothetical protein [Planctomycetota bacterium]
MPTESPHRRREYRIHHHGPWGTELQAWRTTGWAMIASWHGPLARSNAQTALGRFLRAEEVLCG